jgi:DNA-binding response OmpR family regulator
MLIRGEIVVSVGEGVRHHVRDVLGGTHPAVCDALEEPPGVRRFDRELDPGRYQLRVGAVVFDLPRKEFEVMEALMVERGRIVPRDRLLDEIWGITWADSKTLDQHIRRLRRILEQVEGDPRSETVRGVGYRLDA